MAGSVAACSHVETAEKYWRARIRLLPCPRSRVLLDSLGHPIRSTDVRGVNWGSRTIAAARRFSVGLVAEVDHYAPCFSICRLAGRCVMA